MRPSPGDELRILTRSLAEISQYEGLPVDVADDLRDAVRAVQRTEKYLQRLVPYLRSDNERMSVLVRLLESEGADLQPEDIAIIEEVPDATSGNWLQDVDELNQHNERLRAMLSRVISSGAMVLHGPGRDDIGAVLGESVDARPW